MVSTDVIKEEPVEIKKEPVDYQELPPNIFVKQEESYPGPSKKVYQPPAPKARSTVVNGRRYVAYNPKETLRKTYRVNNIVPTRTYTINPEPVDPAFFQVPVFRKQSRPKRQLVLNQSGEPLLRKIPPRFVAKPAANCQEELEKLMNELEKAREKEDTKPKNEPQFPCPIEGCIAIFSSSTGLTRHKHLHKSYLKCPGCEEYFQDKPSLDAHVETHSLDVQFAYEDMRTVPRTMLLVQAPSKPAPETETSSGPSATVKIEEHDDADELLNAILQHKAFPCATGNCTVAFSTHEQLVEHKSFHHAMDANDGLVLAKDENE